MNTATAYHSTGAMSEQDYERERKRIEQDHTDNAVQGQNKNAIRERALAELFARSGWTQQQLAEKESGITGKKVSRPYIAKRLKFGAFLRFVSTGNNPEKEPLLIPIDLNERAFRKYWDQTEKGADERMRFRRVAEMIRQDTEIVDTYCRFKRDQAQAKIKDIIAKFGDGKWHTVEEIAEGIGVDLETAKMRMYRAKSDGAGKCHYESRKYGKTTQYRIIRGGGRKVDMTALEKEIAPILDALDEEGGKNAATMSPPTVLHLAHQLRKLIERLAQ